MKRARRGNILRKRDGDRERKESKINYEIKMSVWNKHNNNYNNNNHSYTIKLIVN